MRTIQRTHELYQEVGGDLLDRGAWLATGEVLTELDEERLQAWLTEMATCGEVGFVEACPNGHGGSKVRTRCCQQKPCPRHQRRQAKLHVARAEAVFHERKPAAGMTWKLVTLNFRGTGDPRADVEKASRLRKNFFRVFKKLKTEKRPGYGRARKTMGVDGGWGAIELGERGECNVHVHALVYSHYLVKDRIESWLRSQDCTVKGCPHPANDRCERCMALGEGDCPHPEAGGRQRCNGSWTVDVRAAKSREGQRTGKVHDAAAAVRECLKYAAKPLLVAPTGGPATEEQRRHVEKVLRFYLALAKRHRVQTYGFARKKTAEEDDAGDDLEPGQGCGSRCPRCRAPLIVVRGYEWKGGKLGAIPTTEAVVRAVGGPAAAAAFGFG